MTAIDVLAPFVHDSSRIRLRGLLDTLLAANLTRVLNNAPEIPFDENSKIALVSDCHRGDGGAADAFLANKPFFLQALNHYLIQEYILIEAGDGDELWKNRSLADIRSAHREVYDFFERFASRGALHRLIGNHELGKSPAAHPVPLQEGLILRYRPTGQRILVTHGHQIDLKNTWLAGISRFFVRHIWRHLQNHGVHTSLPAFHDLHNQPRTIRQAARLAARNQDMLDGKIQRWAASHRQAIICGHTHRAYLPSKGNAPYFNIGSCVTAGQITGLEIVNGRISLVKWSRKGRQILGTAGPITAWL